MNQSNGMLTASESYKRQTTTTIKSRARRIYGIALARSLSPTMAAPALRRFPCRRRSLAPHRRRAQTARASPLTLRLVADGESQKLRVPPRGDTVAAMLTAP